ncbi:unnamed protein product, partial [Ectocarpus sp. 12 AP-2014]
GRRQSKSKSKRMKRKSKGSRNTEMERKKWSAGSQTSWRLAQRCKIHNSLVFLPLSEHCRRRLDRTMFPIDSHRQRKGPAELWLRSRPDQKKAAQESKTRKLIIITGTRLKAAQPIGDHPQRRTETVTAMRHRCHRHCRRAVGKYWAGLIS